jgi:hypothetical protein
VVDRCLLGPFQPASEQKTWEREKEEDERRKCDIHREIVDLLQVAFGTTTRA